MQGQQVPLSRETVILVVGAEQEMSWAGDLIPAARAQLSWRVYVILQICFTPEHPKIIY